MNPEHDGKSLLPMLKSKQGTPARLAQESGWRTSQLIEYLSSGTYYNDHAKLWVSGPGAQPGTPLVYGAGPSATVSPMPLDCEEVTSKTGESKCYFVDSQASNNWIAIRVRNSTHNFVYVESYGAQALKTPLPDGRDSIGVFKCLEGDLCQWELAL